MAMHEEDLEKKNPTMGLGSRIADLRGVVSHLEDITTLLVGNTRPEMPKAVMPGEATRARPTVLQQVLEAEEDVANLTRRTRDVIERLCEGFQP